MNIVFFGSSDFALPSLNRLQAAGHKISCVVTQPDKKKGRGLKLQATPVKVLAGRLGFRLYTCAQINNPESVKFLKGLNPDLFVVTAFGQILSAEVLAIPTMLSINIHASLLPKYRGAAPINWAIINAEEESGVSAIKLTEKMDAGPLISQKKIKIENDDTAISLEAKLSAIGAELLLESIACIENKNLRLMAQDESRVSFARKLIREDGLINWNEPALNIHNLVRGCFDWPGAFTFYEEKMLKIYKTRVKKITDALSFGHPGEILDISSEGIFTAAGKDILVIEELQLAGKIKMTAADFVKGCRLKAADMLGNKK